MATVVRDEDIDATVLHGVTFKAYAQMVRQPSNYRLRMTFHDGVLEIVSPKIAQHEIPSARFFLLVSTIAEVLNLDYLATLSGTFQRRPKGKFRGVGKEPDQSFYIANYHRFPQDRDLDLDAGDPPPDLWIEVDNKVSSAGRLPVYAALGVPEVWCYRSKTNSLEFLRLTDGRYEVIEQSPSLPILTPPRVLEALALGRGVSNLEWVRRLREWARRLADDRAGG